jgi:hypothetical protein
MDEVSVTKDMAENGMMLKISAVLVLFAGLSLCAALPRPRPTQHLQLQLQNPLSAEGVLTVPVYGAEAQSR